MFHAGNTEDINWDSGEWVFLDIGFSEKNRSCGLLIGDGNPVNIQFSDAVKQIVNLISKTKSDINLVVEAPLSVCFNSKGNPKGRRIEKKEGYNPRYWYVGAGAAVMVAAMYLVSEILEVTPRHQLNLFEGFVSYKNPKIRSDHSQDVIHLREVVRAPLDYPYSIVAPSQLRIDDSDVLQSAFTVMGVELGIPPVIRRDAL